ncbi:tripartite tricarboxylate transporter substrate binding protein [soil metagenome]
MTTLFRQLTCALLGASMALAAPMIEAADFPNRQIRIVVPYSPGGSTDALARQIAQKLGEHYKQQVIVDNRPGGNNVVAALNVLSAPPDGYTLLIGDPGLLAINPSLFKKLPYDAKSFAPVAQLTRFSFLVLVNPSNPATTLAQFVANAKASRQPMTYGSASAGTPTHLGMEMLKAAAGFDIVHAPYKGAAPALNDLMGGQIDAMFLDIASAMQYVKSGRLRALAISSKSRSPFLPDVPTIAESGYANFEVAAWNGIVVAKDTPHDVVVQLNTALKAVVNDAQVSEWIRSNSVTPDAAASPEEYGRLIRSDADKWGTIIRDQHITLD